MYKNKPLSYTRSPKCLVNRLEKVTSSLNIGLYFNRADGATSASNTSVSNRCWKRHGKWRSENAKDAYVADFLNSRLEFKVI